MQSVIIIGAGASGLMAASVLSSAGIDTLVLEKEILPGRKILISGNGRCNFTNAKVSPAMYYGDNGFIAAALGKFSLKDCLDYFESLGLLYKKEEGRYFPITGKSSSVADCLVNSINAEIKFKTEVTRLDRDGAGYKVFTANGEVFTACHIILACGSLAYPQAGGTQSGYKLAESIGHSIIDTKPAMCAVNLREKAVARLAGLKVDAGVSMEGFCEIGEIIFGTGGVSGNNVLSISRNAKPGSKLIIDFMPQFTLSEFTAFINKRREQMTDRKVKDFFAGLLADSCANLLVDFLGIKKNAVLNELRPDIFDRIIKTIKAWPFTVESLRPWKEAAAAAGGVNTAEIEPDTFESKKARGVYITGELLDIDGRCGGYNLHFAWACGYSAARAIIKEQNRGKSDNKKN